MNCFRKHFVCLCFYNFKVNVLVFYYAKTKPNISAKSSIEHTAKTIASPDILAKKSSFVSNCEVVHRSSIYDLLSTGVC